MTTRKRKPPNMSEKLASALLHIKRGVEGDDWLIKGDLRKASAKEICSSIDWDHVRRWAENGSNEPQNLQPLARAEHREKSRKDTTEVAKGKRYGAKEEAFRRRLMAKHTGEDHFVEANKKLRKPAFKGWRRFDGSPVYAHRED
jgi:hypothetical protein